MQVQKILAEIETLKDEMVDAFMQLIRIPAVAPDNGGDGEGEKAEKLLSILNTVGFDKIERYDAPDVRVSSGLRPNIVAYLRGRVDSETLWIVTHLDIVPSGEESLWTVTKPFSPIVREGKVYGRGSEDNMQSMVASIFALKCLRNLGMTPVRNVALCFVSDEEQGSKYGILHLAEQRLFKETDLILVPDGGDKDGTFIEVAEKSVLFLKIRTAGRQVHASRPDLGINAHRVGMEFALALDKMLHEEYSAEDRYFDNPKSTFEPTKKERNVEAINIIPGEDVSYFDCRILPVYDLEDVLKNVRELAKGFEAKTGAKIDIEVVQKGVAPKPTDTNAQVVTLLKEAIKKVNGLEPRIGGVGGGTCAAFFRKVGVPAAVWSTVDDMAHQPNEYSKMQNMVNDARVFAVLAAL